MHKHLVLVLGAALLASPVIVLARPSAQYGAQPTVLPTISLSCLDLSNNLSFRSRGRDVVTLQEFLIGKGYLAAGNATGYYGPLTVQAVGRLQLALGVLTSTSDDGYGSMGPLTRAAIACTAPTNPATEPTSSTGSTAPGQGTTSSTGTQTGTPTPPPTTPAPTPAPAPQPCTFSGQSIASGSSVTAYQSSSVAAGQTCASEQRTCADGALSGSYAYASCAAQQPQDLNAPIGYFDTLDAQGNMTGWSVDLDVPSQSINVAIYMDGPAGQGTLVATVPANVSRPDVDSAYAADSVTGNHGFAWTIPAQYLTATHTWYVYGVDSANSSSMTLLTNGPKTFTVQAPVVQSPTPAPVSFSIIDPRGGDSPVISAGDYSYDPSVIYDNGIYRAYWCSDNRSHPGDNILYAEASSPAGPWHAHRSTKAGTADDVFWGTGNSSTFDGLHTCDPSVIKVGSTYYLYYTGAHIAGAIGPNAIGVASSPDGITWTRMNGGQPIVSPANAQAGDGYGAGEPTVAYTGGTYYLMYNDHSGAATYGNGAGEYLISASDPLFSLNVRVFTGSGFVPRTAANATSYVFFNGNNTDLAYVPSWGDFIMLSHSDANETHVVLFDGSFNKLTDQVIAPTQWCDGPGLVTDASRDAIMNGSSASVDFLRAVGTCGDPLTWKLAWRGADLARSTVSTLSNTSNVASANSAFESLLPVLRSELETLLAELRQ